MIKLLSNLNQKLISNKKLLLLFVVETLIFSYIIWWTSELIDLGISFPILLISFVISSYIGLIVTLSGLRYYIALIIFSVLLIIIYFLFYFIISILQMFSEETFGFSFFLFKKYFILIGVFSFIGFAFNWFLFRWKLFFYVELILIISFMVYLFKVHRDYKLSELNILDKYLFFGISEIMVFFIFIFLFLAFIIIFFLFEENSLQFKPKVISSVKSKYTALMTIIGLFILISILGIVLYEKAKEEEPKRGGGIPFQFNENDYLTLYPKVSMNSKERKMVIKMEIKNRFNFVGKMVSVGNQYIRWKVLSGFDTDKNLFYFNKSKFEKDIPNDSEDHYFRLNELKKQIKFKIDVPQMVLGLAHLLTLQNSGLFSNIFQQITESKSHNLDNYIKRRHLDQEYYIIHFAKDAILAINYPILTHPIKNKNPKIFSTSYRAESQVFDGNINDLLQVTNYEGLNNDFIKYFTKSPISSAYKKLAEKITKDNKTPLEKIISLVNYFSQEYKYSLTPGGENETDRLSYFLFENKKGYCTYFAFSLASLLRSLDIPSRVVVGFVTDPFNKRENYYLIHAKDMHAWVEVYFRDYGWITFDATPLPDRIINFYDDSQYLTNLIESLEKESEDDLIANKNYEDPYGEKNKEKSLYWYLLILLFPMGMFTIFSLKKIYKYRCNKEKNPLKKIYLNYYFAYKRLGDLLIK
ncbi:MAG: hypothetical protein OEV44_14620, partial [Spirochaetota bacterium]|nr:hypothetical protein [Spirochaetota bacterium]